MANADAAKANATARAESFFGKRSSGSQYGAMNQSNGQDFDEIKITIASPEKNPLMVLWRGQEAGNHQLPDVQTGERRLVLRADFWAD